MKNIIKILAIASVLSASSCNRMLDIDPSEYAMLTDGYYTTESELTYALNGVYSNLAAGNLYGNSMLGRMGLDGDVGYGDNSLDENTVGDYNVLASDGRIESYWRAVYQGINRANSLLAQIDNPEIEIDDAKREDMRGQALFLRASHYLLLVTRFQGVPLILKPIEGASADDLQRERASGREVYAQIIVDLEAAAPAVKPASEVGSGGRVSKSAVWGLLARVNLYLAGHPYNEQDRYKDALDYAKLVMDENFHALNPSYEQVFINYAQDKYDIKESIFEVEFFSEGNGVYPAAGMVGRNNGIRNTLIDNEIGYASGLLRATEYLYDLYPDTGDVRRDWNIAPFQYEKVNGVATRAYWEEDGSKFQRHCGKFRREYETVLPKHQSQTPQNFPILRYSDVLLMYAEASNEFYKGADDLALACLNQVRRRGLGFDPLIPSTLADATNTSYLGFQKMVREERPRELCFELMRKNDVVRWDVFYDNMKEREAEVPPAFSSSYYVRARSYYGNAQPRDQWWPIPAYEIGVNKKMTQNSGW